MVCGCGGVQRCQNVIGTPLVLFGHWFNVSLVPSSESCTELTRELATAETIKGNETMAGLGRQIPTLTR